MRPLEYYSSLTQIKPGCAGTVHDAQWASKVKPE
jgi:hypothetical protein